MKTVLVVLAVLVAAAVATKELWGTPEERKAIIEEAIAESKLSAQLKSEAAKVKTTSTSSQSKTMHSYFKTPFKKPSAAARRHGASRLMLQDMVKRAERKLEEKKRASLKSASPEEKAEVLAEELLHTPSTLLTKEEFESMYEESGCEEINEFRGRCRSRPTLFTFRSIDGTCNNIRNPLQGASATAFRRLTPAFYEDGKDSLRGAFQGRSLEEESEDLPQIFKTDPFVPPAPSARLVSKTIVRDRPQNETDFAHALMQWGQFLDHDLDLGPEFEVECEGCEFTEMCEPIRVPEDDDVFGLGTPQDGDCLLFRRAIPVCNDDTPGSFSPREQINDLTSYIDGSMVYGSNEFVGDAVREPDSPFLKVGPIVGDRPLLPIDEEEIVACLGRTPRDCFLCGDIRCNEQVSLSTMHTLWVREHNFIAGGLRKINPGWSNERTFQEARKIVGALIQKITYIDYLPKVMGRRVFDITIGPYGGYDRTVDASVPNSFATAAYRYGHSLIRPFFNRLGPGFTPRDPLSLAEMFFRPDQISGGDGTDPIVRGWLDQEPRRMDEFMNSVLTSQLFSSNGAIGMDLASLNIQRQRDHGMAPYGIWRNFCQRVFPELSEGLPDVENQITFLNFLKLYGDINGADLWVAGISEERIPDSLLGPTFACIFGLTFRNVRDGDRFYFERRRTFTRAQLKVIRQQTLSRVICDTTGILEVQPDAFLTNQSRVSCDALPRLDLGPWQEDICFARVTGNFATGQRIVSAVARNTGLSEVELFTNDGNAACVPFTCPTSSFSVNLYIYPAIADLDDCTVQSTLRSLQPVSKSAIAFIRSVTSADITPANGLFRSIESCRSGSINAITWNCPFVPQASSQSDYDINDPSYKDDPALADLFDELNMDTDDIELNTETEAETETETVEKLEVSNQDLLAELQEAMKNLN